MSIEFTKGTESDKLILMSEMQEGVIYKHPNEMYHTLYVKSDSIIVWFEPDNNYKGPVGNFRIGTSSIYENKVFKIADIGTIIKITT